MRYFDRYEDINDDDEAKKFGYSDRCEGISPASIECYRCGKGGLHWEDKELFDIRDKKHICPASKPSKDDFEILP